MRRHYVREIREDLKYREPAVQKTHAATRISRKLEQTRFNRAACLLASMGAFAVGSAEYAARFADSALNSNPIIEISSGTAAFSAATFAIAAEYSRRQMGSLQAELAVAREQQLPVTPNIPA